MAALTNTRSPQARAAEAEATYLRLRAAAEAFASANGDEASELDVVDHALRRLDEIAIDELRRQYAASGWAERQFGATINRWTGVGVLGAVVAAGSSWAAAYAVLSGAGVYLVAVLALLGLVGAVAVAVIGGMLYRVRDDAVTARNAWRQARKQFGDKLHERGGNEVA